MGVLNETQYNALRDQVKLGGSAADNALKQLSGNTVQYDKPATSYSMPAPIQNTVANNTGIPKATTSNNSPTFTPTAYSQGNNFGTSYTASAPNYTTPSTPAYTSPVTSAPATSYTGYSNVIGSVANSPDVTKSYQGIYDQVRANDPTRNQINTWGDTNGNVYDTTNMTPQQIYALSLNKDGNQNAGAILQGMGLDMNGNPTMPKTVNQFSAPPTQNSISSASTYTKNPTVDAMPIDQQLAYYAKNPAEAQQEIARAQGVGGSAATTWANQLSGAISQGSQGPSGTNTIPSTFTGQSGQGGIPSTFNPYGLSQDLLSSITSGADAQTAADIAAQTTIANQQKAAYQQNFDRQNQQTTDTRNLENFKNSQLLNPFNGFSDYTQGQIARERATTDRQNGQDLQTKLGGVDAQLADYSKASQAKKQQLINDMEKQVADYQDQQTKNDIAKSGVTGYYQDSQKVNAVKDQMAKNSAAYASASPAEQKRLHEENIALAQSIGGMDTTGNGDYSFGQGQRTIAGQTLDMNNQKEMATLTGYMSDGKGGLIPTNAKQQQDLTNAWKEAETMGYVTPNLSALTGIKVGTQTQAAKNQAMQNAISQQNADTSSANSNWNMDENNPDNIYKLQEVAKVKAEITQLGKTKPITTQDAVDVLNKSKFVTEEGTTDYNGVFHNSGKTSVDKPGMVQAIAGLGVPDNQMDALFNYYGISQKEVQDIEQQIRVKR